MRHNEPTCPACGCTPAGQPDSNAGPRQDLPSQSGDTPADGLQPVFALRGQPASSASEAHWKVLLLKAKAPVQAKSHDWANDLEWQELRALIVAALEPHPAAYAAVLRALENADT